MLPDLNNLYLSNININDLDTLAKAKLSPIKANIKKILNSKGTLNNTTLIIDNNYSQPDNIKDLINNQYLKQYLENKIT
jgi:hypothetical protein